MPQIGSQSRGSQTTHPPGVWPPRKEADEDRMGTHQQGRWLKSARVYIDGRRGFFPGNCGCQGSFLGRRDLGRQTAPPTGPQRAPGWWENILSGLPALLHTCSWSSLVFETLDTHHPTSDCPGNGLGRVLPPPSHPRQAHRLQPLTTHGLPLTVVPRRRNLARDPGTATQDQQHLQDLELVRNSRAKPRPSEPAA